MADYFVCLLPFRLYLTCILVNLPAFHQMALLDRNFVPNNLLCMKFVCKMATNSFVSDNLHIALFGPTCLTKV